MRWVSASAGAVATASALLVLASAAQPHAGTPAAVGSDAETTTPTQSMSTVPTVDPVASADLVDSVDLTVAGLDRDVSSVLANEGYTDRVQPSELGGQLDPVVAKALADANTVLVIPDGGGR